MRTATLQDREYVAECFIETSLFIKAHSSDVYSAGLPSVVNEGIIQAASEMIKDDDTIIYISERDGIKVGCLIGKIGESSFPPGNLGKVGKIELCWVSEESRNRKIGSALVSQIESWFREKGIDVVELSYMAQNTLAEQVWEGLGFRPFRVFAHKLLSNKAKPVHGA